MSSAVSRRSRPGRPRHIPEADGHLTPREQVLDAAAYLFTNGGFAATSTRDIAERVGIRQASLYYHFANKDEILEELLRKTVRPTLDQLDRIDDLASEHGWAAALYVLVMVDAKTLADAPHNVGRLAYLPDVCVLDLFKPYKKALTALAANYERIGRKVAGLGGDINGIRLMNGTEVIIKHRIDDDKVSLKERHAIAAAALRHCGATQSEIDLAAAVSWAELLDD
ncbi:MAG: TetR/AcrR family transcriptional regulator [Pseudonocardiaceae bacterium]